LAKVEPPASQAPKSLFGAPNAGAAGSTSKPLFGSLTGTTGSAGGLFGAKPAGGGLFGNTEKPKDDEKPKGLFNFGNSGSTAAPATGGGLFGGAKPAGPGSLFGAAPPGGSVFNQTGSLFAKKPEEKEGDDDEEGSEEGGKSPPCYATENDKVEFKGTVQKNQYTKVFDKHVNKLKIVKPEASMRKMDTGTLSIEY